MILGFKNWQHLKFSLYNKYKEKQNRFVWQYCFYVLVFAYVRWIVSALFVASGQRVRRYCLGVVNSMPKFCWPKEQRQVHDATRTDDFCWGEITRVSWPGESQQSILFCFKATKSSVSVILTYWTVTIMLLQNIWWSVLTLFIHELNRS